MPIRVECPTCGLKLQAPDTAAGKQVRCSGCKAVLTVPESVLEAESFGAPPPVPAAVPPIPPPAQPAEDDQGAGTPEGGTERRPCPMCGEMIPVAAAKCRFCGEIFDPTLRRVEQKKSKASGTDADMTVGDWVVAVVCSGIGCIAGVVWMIQGKPKGGKMFGVSLAFAVLWGLVRAAIMVAEKQ